jgi:hypothetical protein
MARYPNGTYLARATESKHGLTKSGGTEIAILFKLLGEQWDGQSITGYVYFTDNTDDDKSMKSLEACGWNGDGIELDPLPGLGSCDVELVIENETFEGKERSKVKYINKVGAVSNSAPMDDAQRKAFAARMRGKIAARGRNGAASSAAPAGGAPDTSDIPF